jgi:outer membrane autotransporter protein
MILWRTHQVSTHRMSVSIKKWRAEHIFLFTGMLTFTSFANSAALGSLNDSHFSQPGFIINNGDTITATASDREGTGYGVLNNSAGGVYNLGSDITINSNQETLWSRGIIMNGDNSSLTADRLTVNSSGTFSEGITVNGGNVQIDLGSNSRINTVDQGNPIQASAVYIKGASRLTADSLILTADGNNTEGLHIDGQGTQVDLGEHSAITTTGNNGVGIYIFGANGNAEEGPATLAASHLNIHTAGANAYGLNIQSNSEVNLGSGSSITTSGTNATGIWAVGDRQHLQADALTINTRGTGANALEAGYGALVDIGAGSQLFSAGGTALVGSEAETLINFNGSSDNQNTLTSQAGVVASAQSGARLNLAYTRILAQGQHDPQKPGYGLWAVAKGQIQGDNLILQAETGNRGIYAISGGEVSLTNAVSIAMASSDDTAMMVDSDENYGAGSGSIRADGVMTITGGVNANSGAIDMNMRSGSEWTGAGLQGKEQSGILNVTMAGSRWNMTGNSSVNTLNLTDSQVYLSGSTPGRTLTVANLSGSGQFFMKTDIAGEGGGLNNRGDKIIVTGTSAGDHQLDFTNQGSAATTGNEVLTVVETPDGAAVFTSTHKVELGGYLYDLRKQDTHWELYAAESPLPPDNGSNGDNQNPPSPNPDTPGGDGDNNVVPPPKPAEPAITTSADAGANFLNVGYLLNFAETQTLMQRMGDLRQSGGGGNMWIRGYAGRFDHFAGGKFSRFTLNYSGTQFGADKRFFENIPLYTGVFMGMTHGNPDYRSGDGTVKSHSVGIYGSWMAANGFYSDAVLKYSHLKNDFNVVDSQGAIVDGQGNSGGVSFSLEGGRKFSLGDTSQNGFYLEPQAQLIWSHQNASHLHASNGLRIGLSSYESVIGRASILAGYEINHADTSINLYLKTGYLREFKGNAGYKLNDSSEDHSFRGGWWNNGLGVSAQFTQQHTLYLDVDSSTGNQFNQRSVNLGYRYSF